MKIRLSASFILLTLFFIVLLLLCVVYKYIGNGNQSCLTDYKWINSELRCEGRPVINKAGYVQFKNKLVSEIEIMKRQGKADEVSVFFRDLENGPTFGINEDTNFVPASLLKTPIMMTYFRIAEEDSTVLTKSLRFSGEPHDLLSQTIQSEKVLEVGKSYSVDELIFRMIAYSDNRALSLLTSYLKVLSPEKDLITETYHELGIIDPGDNITDEAMTVKAYSSIFRLLYNASYLSKEFSEKGLEYLSYSDYEGGLRFGVPSDIAIAHKFGERYLDTGKQLHDCGVVFYPQNPYLMCVMTRGSNFEDLAEVIGFVSKSVYQEVDSRRQ